MTLDRLSSKVVTDSSSKETRVSLALQKFKEKWKFLQITQMQVFLRASVKLQGRDDKEEKRKIERAIKEETKQGENSTFNGYTEYPIEEVSPK